MEDLIGHVRDGVLIPNAELVDVSLEAVDVLKKFLYRDWPDEENHAREDRSAGRADVRDHG